MMSLLHLKLLAALLTLLMAVIAGYYPFHKRLTTGHGHEFLGGEAFAYGVFLGAGLLHMLNDANSQFLTLGYHYPVAYLLAGGMFLLLLWLEQLSKSHEKEDQGARLFALLAVLMLSLHSFLEGAALGLSANFWIALLIFLAIIAHKWAESFALALQINKSNLSPRHGIGLFIIFACMTPLGVLGGQWAHADALSNHVIAPIFSALAAGTFLYLGTLHGLGHLILHQKKSKFSHLTLVVVGFGIMALVAWWI